MSKYLIDCCIAVNYIPVKILEEVLDVKRPYPTKIIIKGNSYILKDEHTKQAHYEIEANDD